MTLRSWLCTFALLSAAAAAPARAKDGPSPEGRWTWTFVLPDGDSVAPVLVLKRDGERLVGTVSARGTTIDIAYGKIADDGTVSFGVERRKFRASYRGKLAGDVIKGTSTVVFDGDERSIPWEAKRVE